MLVELGDLKNLTKMSDEKPILTNVVHVVEIEGEEDWESEMVCQTKNSSTIDHVELIGTGYCLLFVLSILITSVVYETIYTNPLNFTHLGRSDLFLFAEGPAKPNLTVFLISFIVMLITLVLLLWYAAIHYILTGTANLQRVEYDDVPGLALSKKRIYQLAPIMILSLMVLLVPLILSTWNADTATSLTWVMNTTNQRAQRGFVNLQIDYECCGVFGPSDYGKMYLPPSCCPPSSMMDDCTVETAFMKGCLPTVEWFVTGTRYHNIGLLILCLIGLAAQGYLVWKDMLHRRVIHQEMLELEQEEKRKLCIPI